MESVADETVVYDFETKEAHCLKALAAAVFAHADGSRTASEIAELATSQLGTTVTEPDVADAVGQLEQAGLLEMPLVVHSGDGRVAQNGTSVSRREMLRRVGFAGAATAVATPLIMSITASTALATGSSGIPTGCTHCGKNSDCVSNHCCQTVSGKSCNQSCCVGANNSCHITATQTCTVQISDTGCGKCPCGTCPSGSVPCCS